MALIEAEKKAISCHIHFSVEANYKENIIQNIRFIYEL